MSEKRILIRETNPTCMILRELPRTEAVEKMATAMFAKAQRICSSDNNYKWNKNDLFPTTVSFYMGLAEAALDALLQKKH